MSLQSGEESRRGKSAPTAATNSGDSVKLPRDLSRPEIVGRNARIFARSEERPGITIPGIAIEALREAL